MLPGHTMRIAHFVSGFPVLSETFVLDEIQAFAKEGFDNIVVSLRPAQKGREDPLVDLPEDRSAKDLNLVKVLYPDRALTPLGSVEISCREENPKRKSLASIQFELIASGFRFPWELPKLLITASRIGRCADSLEKLGIDHCHAHFAHYPADLAWGCSRLLGVTCSCNAHSYDLWNYQAHKRQRVQAADQVFPISHLNRQHLLQYLPEKSDSGEKILVIHCGIHLEDYPFNPEDSKEPEDPPILLGVGRLVDTKGFADLILAGKKLARQGIRHEIQIIGEGPERLNLEKLAAQNSHEWSTVRFFGALPRSLVRQHQQRASLAVQPCCPGKNGLDGIPVVLMEAMALGTPVISTRFAGIPELIEHRHEGLLVEPASPSQLAEAIGNVLSDPSLRQTFVHRARKKVEDQFNAQKNYRQKALLIKELLRKETCNPV